MVFQSTIPVAFGLAFTDWDLDRFAVVSAVLGLAGGALAYWALRLRGRFDAGPIVVWAALFGAFIVYVRASPKRRSSARATRRRRASSADLREHLGDLALGIDDEGRALHAHVRLAVMLFSTQVP